MFWKNERITKQNAQLTEERDNLVNDGLELEREVRKLNKEVLELKSKKKIEEEEIKHLVKITNEKRDIEFTKKEIEVKKEADEKVYAVREEYQKKVEDNLQKQITDIKETNAQILKRFSFNMKGEV